MLRLDRKQQKFYKAIILQKQLIKKKSKVLELKKIESGGSMEAVQWETEVCKRKIIIDNLKGKVTI